MRGASVAARPRRTPGASRAVRQRREPLAGLVRWSPARTAARSTGARGRRCGVGDVGERGLGVRAPDAPTRRAAPARSAASVFPETREEVQRPLRLASRGLGDEGRLLEDDVRVGAAEPEGADAGDAPAARCAATAPLRSESGAAATTQAMWGFGSLKCRCGGIASCCRESTTLMSPAIPAAASRCPMFVLTEPTMAGRPGSRPGAQHGAEGARLDGVAERGAGAVGLDVVRPPPARSPRRRGPRGSPPPATGRSAR